MTESPQQVVFIDSRVPDIQDLLSGLAAGEQAFVIDPSSDGIQQIADILAANNFTDLSSISIVSHGESGELELGSSLVTDANLAGHSNALAEIGAALAPGGNIRLYGCDVAQGAAGQQFVNDFSTFTGGAQVNASTQPVGSPAWGGSWTLNTASVSGPGAAGADGAAPLPGPGASLASIVNGANAPFTANALANFQGTLGPAAASDPELWIASDLSGGDIVHVDDVAGSATNATTLYAGNPTLTGIQDVVLDPTDQVYFVLRQDAAGNDQILEGSLTQALNTPGATPNFTTVFTDSSTGDIITQIALDTVSHQIYFADNLGENTGTNVKAEFDRVNYGGGAVTTLATVATESGAAAVEVTGFALDLNLHDAVFAVNQGGSISFTHTSAPQTFLYEASGVSSAATSVAISQLPIGGAGTFTLDPSLGFFDNVFPGEIAIDPTTHKLYFTLENGDTGGGLFEYNLTGNPNGAFTTIWQQTPAGPTGAPNALVIDPTTGEYFIAFDGGTNATHDQYNGVWRGLLAGTAAPTAFLTTPTFPADGGDVPLELSLDQQPTLSITPTNPTFTESSLNPASSHNTPVGLLSGATATDPDNDALVSATVSIGGFFAGDTLTFSNNNNITGSYNSSTGVLTFSGVDSFADYATALQSVQFTSTSDNPTDYGSDSSRTLAWTVNDGLITSSPQTETLSVIGVNDPPALSSVAGSKQFTEEGGAVTLSGALSVSDPDDLNLSSATVSITGGRFTNDGDVLGFNTASTSVTASYDSSTETLTLSGTDTLAHYQQVLDSVTFNDGENPTNYGSNTTRTITWVAQDPSGTLNGGQDTSTLSTTTVSLTNVNDPPTLALGSTTAQWTEEQSPAATTLSPTVSVTDADNLDLVSATVQITGGTFAIDSDVLSAAGSASISVSYNSTTETLTLTGSDSLANYQAVLDSVTFNAGENPTDFGSDPTRTVVWTLNDGGGTANGGSQIGTATSTISVTNVNDPPTLSSVATGAQFTEEGGAVTLSGALSVTDPDDLNLSSATVSITGGKFTSDGDVLGFNTASTSVTASYDSSTETLTLSGTDTLAHYQQVLDSVTFNDGENPTNYGSNTTRSITWVVQDPSGTLNGGSDANSPINTTTVSLTNVNDPPTLALGSTVASWTEEGAIATLSPTVTITDPDNLDLSSATVQITGGTFAGDVLSATGTASISVSYNSTTETLTLTGSDTLADYHAALESVTFQAGENPTDFGSDPTRTVVWTLDDGGGTANGGVQVSSVTSTISITNINDPPTLSNVAASVFAGPTNTVTLSASVTVTDPDDLDLEDATVSITGGTFAGDGDVLSATGTATISVSYNSSTETLTLTGTDTLAHYQTVLDSVTWHSTAGDPTNAGADPSRTISWVVQDPSGTANGGSDTSTPQTETLTMDQPPTLSNVAATAVWTEESQPTTLANAITISDPDGVNTQLSATVSIVGGTFANDHDVLAATPTGNITVSYNSSTETLTLTGSDSLANYETVLDFVVFNAGENPADFGSNPTRSITWVVASHLGADSAPQTTTVSLTNVNDPPTLGSVATTAFFTEEGAAVRLSSAVSVSDPDNLDLVSATLRITGGTFVSDGDQLGVNVAGTSITASYTAATETLILTGSDSLAHYQQVLDTVTFSAGPENPNNFGSNPTRTVTWVLNDGSGSFNLSTPVTSTISVTNVNDAPTLSNVATSQSYTEEGPAKTLSSAVSVSDSDNVNLAGATVKIIGGTFAGDGDVLAATTTGTSITASYNSSTETLTLSGADTLAHYQTVLDSVAFNAGENPNDYGSNPTRTLTWVLNDGSASNNLSTAVTETVSVTNVNDPPTISSVASVVSVRAAQPTVTVSPNASVSDPDNLTLAGATVSITGGTFAGDGDVLAATITGTSITASYNSTTETLTLTGSDTLAHYAQVLDSVTYDSTSANPTNSGVDRTRTVSWVVNDGSGSSNLSAPATTTINFGGAAPYDFNGDGKSDLLFQNTNATPQIWLMNGTSVISETSLPDPPVQWRIVGSGDFNGDGKADILWINTIDNTPSIWEMNGTSIISAVALPAPPTSWRIAGIGDVFGDGDADIIWQNSDGTPSIWEMNGTSIVSAVALTAPPPQWKIVGTGDFNGDGKTDLLWLNTNNNQPAIWEMNGFSTISAVALTPQPANMEIIGTGDFAGNGDADILWLNTSTNAPTIWMMNGTSVVSMTTLVAPPPSWRLVGTSDVNGDGKADILWQNSNGTATAWEMNGTSIISAVAVGNPGAAWQLNNNDPPLPSATPSGAANGNGGTMHLSAPDMVGGNTTAAPSSPVAGGAAADPTYNLALLNQYAAAGFGSGGAIDTGTGSPIGSDPIAPGDGPFNLTKPGASSAPLPHAL